MSTDGRVITSKIQIAFTACITKGKSAAANWKSAAVKMKNALLYSTVGSNEREVRCDGMGKQGSDRASAAGRCS